MLFQILRLSEINQVYQRALTMLNRDVKVIRNRTGWHQFLGEQKVGDVATGQGLLILSYLKCSHRLLNDLKASLRQGQHLGDSDLERGGWSFTTCQEAVTVEASAWVTIGLLAAGEPQDSDAVKETMEWMKKNQNIDGGWGPRKGLMSRTYATFMAINCFSQRKPYFDINSSYLLDARSWLISCQNADGGWGPITSEASTPVHTAFAMLALIMLGIDSASKEIQRGINYLYDNWNHETTWEHTSKFEQYEIPKEGMAWTRITFHYFPTAWIITALLTAEECIFQKQIFSSVKWLIHSQNDDGSWSISDVPKNRFWAIHDAILAITTFVDKAISTKTVDRMVLLDEILILTKGHKGNGLTRIALLAILGLLLLGSTIGVILSSATSLHLYVGPWIQRYWAWLLLGIYVASVYPLVRLKIISRKEALIGMLIPALLIIIQIYLRV